MVRRIVIISVAILVIALVIYFVKEGPGIVFSYMLERDALFGEQQRVTSPDGKVDAVLMSYDIGAMAATDNTIWIVPAGEKLTKKKAKGGDYHPIFGATHVSGLKFFWGANKELKIEYYKADIYLFRNHMRPLADKEYEVEITEGR